MEITLNTDCNNSLITLIINMKNTLKGEIV